MLVEIDKVERLMAGLVVAAASGSFTGPETQRAVSSAEASGIRKAAQGLANPCA